MGMFAALRNTAVEIHEDARGRILHGELTGTLRAMQSMPEAMVMEIGSRFSIKRSRLLANIGNWTVEGQIRMADTLRTESRKQLDFNVVEGYALWMTSAWLESGVRQSDLAQGVLRHLDEFGRGYAQALKNGGQQ